MPVPVLHHRQKSERMWYFIVHFIDIVKSTSPFRRAIYRAKSSLEKCFSVFRQQILVVTKLTRQQISGLFRVKSTGPFRITIYPGCIKFRHLNS